MVSPCDNCVHKFVCHYRPQMEQLSNNIIKIFSEINNANTTLIQRFKADKGGVFRDNTLHELHSWEGLP